MQLEDADTAKVRAAFTGAQSGFSIPRCLVSPCALVLYAVLVALFSVAGFALGAVALVIANQNAATLANQTQTLSGLDDVQQYCFGFLDDCGSFNCSYAPSMINFTLTPSGFAHAVTGVGLEYRGYQETDAFLLYNGLAYFSGTDPGVPNPQPGQMYMSVSSFAYLQTQRLYNESYQVEQLYLTWDDQTQVGTYHLIRAFYMTVPNSAAERYQSQYTLSPPQEDVYNGTVLSCDVAYDEYMAWYGPTRPPPG